MNRDCETVRSPKYDPMAGTDMHSGATLRGPETIAKRPRDFGLALEALWSGQKVFRHTWNGKGMYLCLQVPDNGSKMSRPYIYMRTADNELVPWVASQSDLLAHDWEVFK